MNSENRHKGRSQLIMAHVTKVARLSAPYLNNTECVVHGKEHLCYVAWLAGRLAGTLDECLESAVVGGYLHDCARTDDEGGNRHAHESATLARRILAQYYAHLDVDRLSNAIYLHADGLVSEDPLIACIWDADRISLRRLGMVVDLRLLSTELAKRLCRFTQPRA